MSILDHFKNWLEKHWREPLAPADLAGLESGTGITRHREIIRSKPFLRRVYRDWFRQYGPVLDATRTLSGLPAIELGSGAGLVHDYYPEVIRTDVVKNEAVDVVVRADAIPFEAGSLRAILMTDVLHHLPHPREFFREAVRCLAIGGRVLMVEPGNSWWCRLVWRNFHPREDFDATIPQWETATVGRLTKANMALAWIILVRDRKRFEAEFPELKICSMRHHTVLSYFLTGGLTYRAFLPLPLAVVLLRIEPLIVRIFPGLASMMTLELERVAVQKEQPESKACHQAL